MQLSRPGAGIILACSLVGASVPTTGALRGLADHSLHRVSRASASVEPTSPAQLGGMTYALTLAGSHAFVAVGPRVAVLDVSNLARPRLVGQSQPLSNVVMGIVLAGGHAYVATQGGFSILDVSDPTQPREIGISSAGGHGLALVENYVYLAGATAGLRIIDVSDPTQPRQVAVHDTPGFAEAVTVVGQYAYVADQASGLRIIDVSNPRQPAEIGFYDTAADAGTWR